MQTDNINPALRRYRTVAGTAQLLWKEGGVKRFYRGFTPCLMVSQRVSCCRMCLCVCVRVCVCARARVCTCARCICLMCRKCGVREGGWESNTICTCACETVCVHAPRAHASACSRNALQPQHLHSQLCTHKHGILAIMHQCVRFQISAPQYAAGCSQRVPLHDQSLLA